MNASPATTPLPTAQDRARDRARRVTELLALLDQTELDDTSLGEIFVEATKMTHRFPIAFPEFAVVAKKAVTNFADSTSVHKVLMSSPAVAGSFLPALAAITTDRGFLDRVVRRDWTESINHSWDISTAEIRGLVAAQRTAFGRLANTEYVKDLCVNGLGLARVFAFEVVQDRSVIHAALTSDKEPIAVISAIGQRFIDDAEFRPLIVGHLMREMHLADQAMMQSLGARSRGEMYGMESLRGFAQARLSDCSMALSAVLKATSSPEVAGQIVNGLADLETGAAQSHASSVHRLATKSFPNETLISPTMDKVHSSAGRSISLTG